MEMKNDQNILGMKKDEDIPDTPSVTWRLEASSSLIHSDSHERYNSRL